MLKTILLPLASLCFISGSGQTRNAIELYVVSRYDRHANYETNFAGRSYNDTMKLFGLSSGANVQCRKALSPTYSITFGVGYYRLGVNKIRSSMPFGNLGVATARSINNEDDDSTKLGYSTSKYHYNNLAFTVGLSKLYSLQNRFSIDIGAEGVGYYSFSQDYNLMNRYHYSTTNPKQLEFGINATVGLMKEYNKFYIRPALLVPIYQLLKGDRAFDEKRNMSIPKWFNGIGLTFRIGKYL
jgi:hypothetical protein